jgi:hypothetical protein
MTPYPSIRRIGDRPAPPPLFEWAATSNQRETKALRLYQPPHIGELADQVTRASKIQPLIPK